jgi:hypothetical protein
MLSVLPQTANKTKVWDCGINIDNESEDRDEGGSGHATPLSPDYYSYCDGILNSFANILCHPIFWNSY